MNEQSLVITQLVDSLTTSLSQIVIKLESIGPVLKRIEDDNHLKNQIDIEKIKSFTKDMKTGQRLTFTYKPGTGIVVADAETDGDLLALAQAAAASGVRLFCGSAGLAHALSRVLPQRPAAPAPAPAPFATGPVLVVAGSRHPKTARQVEFAVRQGAAVVRLSRAFLDGEGDAVERTCNLAAGHLGAGRHAILAMAGTDDCPLGGRAVAMCLAQTAKRLVTAVGGMVLTGGDIAAAVCEALEVPAIRLIGEVEPGMPLGLLIGGRGRGLRVVTKAGGFGGEESIAVAIRCLSAAHKVV